VILLGSILHIVVPTQLRRELEPLLDEPERFFPPEFVVDEDDTRRSDGASQYEPHWYTSLMRAPPLWQVGKRRRERVVANRTEPAADDQDDEDEGGGGGAAANRAAEKDADAREAAASAQLRREVLACASTKEATCKCGGASIENCAHMARMTLDSSPLGAEPWCCLCDLDSVPVPDVKLRTELSFMQGVCAHCRPRVGWQTTGSDECVRPLWTELHIRENNLDFIEAVCDTMDRARAMGDHDTVVVCNAALCEARHRLRQWVSIGGTVPLFDFKRKWRSERHYNSRASAAFAAKNNRYAAAFQAADRSQGDLVRVRANAFISALDTGKANPRDHAIMATLRYAVASEPAKQRTDSSFSLGLFMQAAESMSMWFHQELDQARSIGVGNNVFFDYLMPLNTEAIYCDYVARQKTDSCMPLLESAFYENAVFGASEHCTAVNDPFEDKLAPRIQRLLCDNCVPRPLTDTPPYMLEAMLTNWYADCGK